MAIVNIYESNLGAVEGAPAEGSAAELRQTKRNDAALAPGRVVVRDGNDVKVKVPTTAAEVLNAIGVAELSDTQSLTAGAYPANTRLSIVRKGVIWMVAVTAAVQGAPVFVYYGAGDTTLRGKVGGSHVDGEASILPGARFASTQATPGSLVKVEFDLPGDAGAAAGFGGGLGYVDVTADAIGNVVAGRHLDVSTAVTGALAGDVFVVTALTALEAGIIICDSRCRVDGTVVWRVGNLNGTDTNPASNTFRFSLVSRG